ncbi:hypothetical protein XELAEV_18036337mg [Xenopus laevis]|uniref:Uncharacterized protein n=1 Tax=Xenopus laevis TaxID=8355 RepID=A0A974HCX8_XENLA|nr:hypothetical protein XELAEV_18036337mg [Xenopus laevis]
MVKLPFCRLLPFEVDCGGVLIAAWFACRNGGSARILLCVLTQQSGFFRCTNQFNSMRDFGGTKTDPL